MILSWSAEAMYFMEADVYLENQIKIRDIFACGIRNPEKSCIFGIQLKESRNFTNDWNPDFEFYVTAKYWNPGPGI